MNSNTSSGRREEILFAAARLFMKSGYQATSLRQIADVMGFTEPAIYYYFSSKEELLYAVMDYALGIHERTVARVLQSTTDPAERLRLLLRGIVLDSTQADEEGAFSLLLDADSELTPEHRDDVRRRRRATVDLFRQIIEQLKLEGRSRIGDTVLATFSLLSVATDVPRWYRPNGRLSGEEVADEVAAMAVRLLLNPDTSVPEIANRDE